MKKRTSKQLIKSLYNEDFNLKTEDNKEFIVTENGSLGLLALGYKGLIAWRKKKNKVKK